jgi:hypothetical protein
MAMGFGGTSACRAVLVFSFPEEALIFYINPLMAGIEMQYLPPIHAELCKLHQFQISNLKFQISN